MVLDIIKIILGAASIYYIAFIEDSPESRLVWLTLFLGWFGYELTKKQEK